MEEEYVVTVARKHLDHPLTPAVLIEFGVDAAEPRALKDALAALVGMLDTHVTPEAVVKFMRQHAALAKLLGK